MPPLWAEENIQALLHFGIAFLSQSEVFLLACGADQRSVHFLKDDRIKLITHKLWEVVHSLLLRSPNPQPHRRFLLLLTFLRAHDTTRRRTRNFTRGDTGFAGRGMNPCAKAAATAAFAPAAAAAARAGGHASSPSNTSASASHRALRLRHNLRSAPRHPYL